MLVGLIWGLSVLKLSGLPAQNQEIVRTTRLLGSTQRLYGEILSAELSERLFVSTYRQSDLTEFHLRVQSATAEMTEISELTQGMGKGSAIARELSQAVQSKCAEMTLIIETRRNRGFDKAYRIMSASEDRDLFVDLRNSKDELNTESLRILTSHVRAVQASMVEAAWGGAIGLVILLIYGLLRRVTDSRSAQ